MVLCHSMSEIPRHTMKYNDKFHYSIPFQRFCSAQMIETIRKKIPYEEFDYQTLQVCLSGYAHPRDKISDLLKKGAIIRIKKGLYIFGDDYRRRPYSREILANLIYGPSYISLDFALQHYGLIPERVEVLTSVTTGRSRKFFTPVGLFTYHKIPLKAFRMGMARVELDDERAFLMATPEKALADKLQAGRGLDIRAQRDVRDYMDNNLRIDPAVLGDLNPTALDAMALAYRSRKIRLLSEVAGRARKGEQEGNLHA